MKKIIVRSIAAVFVLAVLAFVLVLFYLNTIVKSGVEQVGPAVTKTTVKLDAADLSLLSGEGGLKNMLIGNPEGFKSSHAIQMGEVKLAVQPSTLLGDKVVVKSVRVVAPKITYEIGLKGSNLNKLLENIQSMVPEGTSKSGGSADNTGASKKIQLDDLLVSGGEIQIAATVLGGQGVTIPLPEIHLSNLGQGPDGVTVGEVIKMVFSEVVTQTTKAVGSVSGKAAEAAKDAGKSALEKAKGLGDMFKKKP